MKAGQKKCLSRKTVGGPQFISYFQPIVSALRELGYSARPKEVFDWIIEKTDVSKEDLESTNKNGQSRFENRVAWARFYLAKSGYINTEQRGIWVLSEIGKNLVFTTDTPIEIFRSVQAGFGSTDGSIDAGQT